MTEESNMVNVYLMGKKYEVPEGLTIMGAMEYAGYKLVRGCGCRNGFCGACATVYRIKGERELHAALACQTTVQENMYIATLPFFPLEKQVYDINEIKPDAQVMMQLYPEIYSCIGCNACTNACTQGLNVMQYIAAAQRGDFKTCAELSFDCVMCGVCSSRCPAGISHPQVAELARRLNGKYIAPEAKHLTQRVKEIQDGLCEAELEAIMAKPVDELKELYNHRVIEK
ncbi:MAG: 4Fe-4S dicluster domain-containing protein [Christensenellales bacterium]